MQRSVTAEESYRRGRDHLERGEVQPRARALPHRAPGGPRQPALPLVLRARSGAGGATLRSRARAVPLRGEGRVLQPRALPQPRARPPRVRLQGRSHSLPAPRPDDRSRERGDADRAERARTAPPAGAVLPAAPPSGEPAARALRGHLAQRPTRKCRPRSPPSERLRERSATCACVGSASAASSSCACASSSGAS